MKYLALSVLLACQLGFAAMEEEEEFSHLGNQLVRAIIHFAVKEPKTLEKFDSATQRVTSVKIDPHSEGASYTVEGKKWDRKTGEVCASAIWKLGYNGLVPPGGSPYSSKLTTEGSCE